MDGSPYLAQALQSLGQPAPGPTASPFDPIAMQRLRQTAQAYQAQDPGGSYLGHNLMQAGRNLMGAPDRLGDSLSGGLGALARMFGQQQAPPY